jgi:Na+-driven multidrug efflux pump
LFKKQKSNKLGITLGGTFIMNLILFKLANMVTNFNFLGINWDDPQYQEIKFLEPILEALNLILFPLMILVATAGSIYAVILGVNMAKAETADKREEAKKRIINAVLALVITIVLILLLQLFATNLPNWITEETIVPGDTTGVIGML